MSSIGFNLDYTFVPLSDSVFKGRDWLNTETVQSKPLTYNHEDFSFQKKIYNTINLITH